MAKELGGTAAIPPSLIPRSTQDLGHRQTADFSLIVLNHSALV